jgi:ribosomal protein S18 acetylase RimI-like enzyme
VRPLLSLTPAAAPAVRRFILAHWGADFVVAHGRVYHPHALPGFAAYDEAGEIAALTTYCLEGDDCEIVTLDSLRPGQGLGSARIAAVVGVARAAGCRRVWLITTNDNLRALRFYQKRGFRLLALYPNALDATRRLKPGLPALGFDGIPLRDELALELPLDLEA